MKTMAVNFFKSMVPPRDAGTRPYEWMIKGTPQKEWIEQKGMLLWLAFFFSEIGAGLYFVSLFLSCRTGLIMGWLITLGLGGIVHMLYLGNPKRFWRIFMRPGASELSRGVWIIGFFAVLGFFQIILPGGFNPMFNVIMGIISLAIIMHGFATMNVMRALPAWNSSMVLPLSVISGIWVGSQILQFMLATGGAPSATAMEVWAELLFFIYLALLLFYLWGTFHSSQMAKHSIKRLLQGDMKRFFYTGVVGTGLVLPFFITLLMWGGDVNPYLLFLRLIFVLVGDLAMRYALMKSALYAPLI